VNKPVRNEGAYLELLQRILDEGTRVHNRTGVDALAVFGSMMQFDLDDGKFPLLTTKKVHIKSVVAELLWMISGSTNVKPLQDQGVRIWNEWAKPENGELGPVYGHQWRKWNAGRASPTGRDQLTELIDNIRKSPESRRLILTAWNPDDIAACQLPPCHVLAQFRVLSGKLHCSLTQRSGDMFLGIPFNIASYSLLTYLIAKITDLQPGTFTHYINDAHIYVNHLDQCRLQLSRTPYAAPRITVRPPVSKLITDYKAEDIDIVDYSCHPAIAAPVAV
jgi:thymidylate synthase